MAFCDYRDDNATARRQLTPSRDAYLPAGFQGLYRRQVEEVVVFGARSRCLEHLASSGVGPATGHSIFGKQEVADLTTRSCLKDLCDPGYRPPPWQLVDRLSEKCPPVITRFLCQPS